MGHYTVKTHLKWHCHSIPWPGYSGLPQCSGTHLLTRLVLHAILSESGPKRACHYTRDNPLFTYSGMSKPNTFFPLRTVCPNDAACMGPLIVACDVGMPKSIRTAGFPGIVACHFTQLEWHATISDFLFYFINKVYFIIETYRYIPSGSGTSQVPFGPDSKILP